MKWNDKRFTYLVFHGCFRVRWVSLLGPGAAVPLFAISFSRFDFLLWLCKQFAKGTFDVEDLLYSVQSQLVIALLYPQLLFFLPVECVPDVGLLLNEFVEFMTHKHASWSAMISYLMCESHFLTEYLIAVNLASENATMDLTCMDTNLKVNVLDVRNRGTVLLIFDYL